MRVRRHVRQGVAWAGRELRGARRGAEAGRRPVRRVLLDHPVGLEHSTRGRRVGEDLTGRSDHDDGGAADRDGYEEEGVQLARAVAGGSGDY